MLNRIRQKVFHIQSSSSKGTLNALLTILGLIYLICIPMGKIQDNHRFRVQDLGVVMILIAVNSNLIERIKKIGPDGIDLETAKKVATEQANNVYNERDDAGSDAIRAVDLQLSESTTLNIKPEELREKISKVSATVAECIYYRAKDARHYAWLDKQYGTPKRGIIERTIPVFQALVHTEHGKDCHRFYAQLGYALKDQEQPDWKDAEENLERAITLWEQQHPYSPLPSIYCFNWLFCIVKLNAGNQFKYQYTNPEKEKINQRLEAAIACDRFTDALRKSQDFQQWRQQNVQWLREDINEYVQDSCTNLNGQRLQTGTPTRSTCSSIV